MAKIETHLSLIVKLTLKTLNEPSHVASLQWAIYVYYMYITIILCFGAYILIYIYILILYINILIGELACNKERCLQITNRQDKTSGERKNHWKSYDNNNVNHQACSFPCNFSQSHLEPLQTDP